MATEVEVVEVAAAKALLPNLTICVDRDDDNNTVLDLEYENKSNVSICDTDSNKDVSVHLKPTAFPRQKLYKNSQLAGIESLGISFDEAKAKRQERANRFKSPLVDAKKETTNFTEEELDDLAKKLLEDVNEYNANQKDQCRLIRPEALYIHGVDKMSTEDIFSFCGSTYPSHIEWINDISCNIVWTNELQAAKALEKIAPIRTKERAEPTVQIKKQGSSEDFDSLDLDEEAMEIDKDDKKSTNTGNGMNAVISSVFSNALRKCPDPYIKRQNNKKHYLSLRFTEMADKKEGFAAKKSQFYRDFGNPHYNGTRGILSASFRKRFQMKKARNELRDLNVDVETSTDQLDARAKRFSSVSILKQDPDAEEEPIKTEKEKDDEHLVKSSANDLSDAVRVYSSGESSDDDYGTMVADQIERTHKSARHKPAKGELRITTSNQDVKSRLGQRPLSQNVIKSENESLVSDTIDLHPTDLRNRIGKKRPTASSFFSTDHSESKRMRKPRMDEEYDETSVHSRTNRNREEDNYHDDEYRKDSSYSSSSRSKKSSRSKSDRHGSRYDDSNRSSRKSSKPSSNTQSERSNGRTLVRYSPSPFDD